MIRVTVYCALVFALAHARASDWPVASSEGDKALDALIEKCVERGGLKMRAGLQTKARVPEVADARQLRAAVAAGKADLTPALRDALVARIAETTEPDDTGLITLLAAVAAESRDDRARGFAALFQASAQRSAGRTSIALLGFAAAAGHFEKARDYGWEATARNERGTLLSRSGALDAAVTEHKQAMGLRLLHFGPQHPIVAVSYNNLGAAYHRLGRFADAAAAHESAVRIRLAAGVPPVLLAHSLLQLGVARIGMGHTAAADRALAEALKLARRGKDRKQIAEVLGALGGAAEARGDYDTFLRYAREAGDVMFELHGTMRHRDVLLAAANLGNAHHRRGDLHAARMVHEVVLRIRRELFAGDDPDTASSLNNLTSIYLTLGRVAEAEATATECLDMRRRLIGSRPHPEVARALNNLAEVKARRGDPAAPLVLQQALTVWEAVHGDRPHPDTAICLDNLSTKLRADGRGAEAALFASRAAKQFRRLYGPAHPEYAVALGNQAAALAADGDPGAAEVLDRAIAALAAHPGPLPAPDRLTAADLRALPVTVSLLYQRARLEEEASAADPDSPKWAAAARRYALAAAVFERVRRDNLGRPESRLAAGEERHNLFVRLVGAQARLYGQDGKAEHLEAAFRAAEQAIARGFLDALAESRVGSLTVVPPELRPQATRLATWRKDLDLRVARLRGDPKEGADLFDENRKLQVEEQAFERRLEAEHPAAARWLHPRPCDLAEARAALGPNEVAVIYLTGSAASYAVVVNGRPEPRDPTGGLAVVPLPPVRALGSLVAAATDRDTLSRDARARASGEALFELLLAPLADRIGNKDLVIVPGGDLGELPFELLVRDDRYLIETRRVRYAPSLSALHLQKQWERGRARPVSPLFAVGDPVYDRTDPRAAGAAVPAPTAALLTEYQGTRSPGGLTRLQATAAEVEAVRRQLRAAAGTVRVGFDATEQAVRDASASGELPRCRYVHFATHGFLGFDAGPEPALVLSLVAAPGDGVPDADGFLTLSEVLGLRLNADLVVLSACETGRGRAFRAEGVSGLARGFLFAGSRGVACSLWSVDDTATADLMAGLYTRLAKGASTAAALREAKLDLIRTGRPPFFWAAFVLNGE